LTDTDKTIDAPERDVEGFGERRSSGLPAQGHADTGGLEPLGTSGRQHWRESTISNPDLDERGNVFFAAVEMTRMPMILTDPNQDDNPIVFANKAFLDLTGYENEEILGRNCRFLQGPQTDREQVAELRDAIAARESISLEILNYKRDGTPFWNAVFIGPVYDRKGELLYFFASQLDVTRRKNTEQAYRQAQKMEAIGQLTAGLAHDFNNLLQVVNGNLEMIAGKIDAPQVSRYVDNARSAAERGARLTRQLLAFARKTRLHPKLVDFNELINDFAPLVESTLGPQIELHLSLRRSLPPVMVDREQLEMALLNVLMNARDAMPDGGLVTIATAPLHLNGDAAARELPPGDYVVLEIRDQGQGMTPDVLRRAHEPFFTTKGVGKGTGLGLAMASGFAQQSRGRLEIESTPGEGAIVRFLLPVARQTEATERDRPTVQSMVETKHGGPEHILVVEDQPEVQDLACEILEEAGYRVTRASDAAQALRLFDAHPGAFDLVFTDVLMPGGLNGIQLAETLAEREPALPVLLTTGYNDDLVAAGPDRPGFDVLGKPYRRVELTNRVGQALRGDGARTRRRSSDFGAAEG
jgi:PAS domain S-box-containing protein